MCSFAASMGAVIADLMLFHTDVVVLLMPFHILLTVELMLLNTLETVFLMPFMTVEIVLDMQHILRLKNDRTIFAFYSLIV